MISFHFDKSLGGYGRRHTMIFFVLVLSIVVAIVVGLQLSHLSYKREAARESAKLDAMTCQEREIYLEEKRQNALTERIRLESERKRLQERSDRWAYGDTNAAMICPHCNTKGQIRTKIVENKKGVSGGKATAALLTGGVSLLATGLSRKEEATQARCGNCTNTWSF